MDTSSPVFITAGAVEILGFPRIPRNRAATPNVPVLFSAKSTSHIPDITFSSSVDPPVLYRQSPRLRICPFFGLARPTARSRPFGRPASVAHNAPPSATRSAYRLAAGRCNWILFPEGRAATATGCSPFKKPRPCSGRRPRWGKNLFPPVDRSVRFSPLAYNTPSTAFRFGPPLTGQFFAVCYGAVPADRAPHIGSMFWGLERSEVVPSNFIRPTLPLRICGSGKAARWLLLCAESPGELAGALCFVRQQPVPEPPGSSAGVPLPRQSHRRRPEDAQTESPRVGRHKGVGKGRLLHQRTYVCQINVPMTQPRMADLPRPPRDFCSWPRQTAPERRIW